jgi:hypothetical protein
MLTHILHIYLAYLSKEDLELVSSCGDVTHIIKDSDTLIHSLQGRGKMSLEALARSKTLHTQSCVLVRSSLVLSLRLSSVSQCVSEWKRTEAEEAEETLSRIYPFSSWKHKELSALAALARKHEFQRGDLIFEQASAANQVVFIQRERP